MATSQSKAAKPAPIGATVEHGEDSAAAWRTALLMMACFVIAQADKQVIGLLAVPIQEALVLNDTQLGFLQGGAFAIAFAIGGLPIAHWLDRGHRVRIASACVAAWSLATILCGLATSFVSLLLFRAATAFAEAGLPPAAFSIFSQSADTRMSARLTGTFMLAPFIGGGAVMLLGGLLLQQAMSGQISVAGVTEGWRLVFILVGLPGLLLAPALFFFGHEPMRPVSIATKTDKPSYVAVLRLVFSTSAFLRNYYLGLTCFYLFTAALIGWFPTFLVRQFSIAPSSAGFAAGITFLICGVAGTLAVTVGSTLRKAMDVADILRIYLFALALLLPVTIALPIVNTMWAALVLYGVYAFLSALILASMAVPLQRSLPNAMQARGIALFSLLVSALAGSAGPLIVGLLSDIFPISLGTVLSIVGGSSSISALLLLAKARLTSQ